MTPSPLTLPVLDGPVRHGFFTRRGGVSAGLYDSLNCGFGGGDDPDAVALNRARALAALDGEALAGVHQRHTAIVHVVGEDWTPGPRPVGDGLATRRRGVALAILAADCAPVLFADPEAGVIGAAHAGWRGALGGVLDATVAAMVGLGARADRIAAAIGPCMMQGSYEVGPEFPGPFVAEDAGALRFFAPGRRAGRHQFDLPGYVAHRLARLDLAAVAAVGRDTCGEPDLFFSYRRSVLNREGDYGRLISLVMLAPRG